MFVLSVLPYGATLVYSYKLESKLNKAGLYKPGAWQVLMGGLILNPWLLGVIIPASALRAERKARASLETQKSSRAEL